VNLLTCQTFNNIEAQHIIEAWGEGQEILPFPLKSNNSMEHLVGNEENEYPVWTPTEHC
jgi:hypothetical protein